MNTLPANYDRDYRKVYRQILGFFKEERKANIWMKAKNAQLGDVSPIEMLLVGRGEELKKFVTNLTERNVRKNATAKG